MNPHCGQLIAWQFEPRIGTAEGPTEQFVAVYERGLLYMASKVNGSLYEPEEILEIAKDPDGIKDGVLHYSVRVETDYRAQQIGSALLNETWLTDAVRAAITQYTTPNSTDEA